MTKRLLITMIACLLSAAGCNIIYKQNIQQGNALEQEDLDQLRPGMSMNQVAYLLGTPAIRDPFHHDRWDYVSSFARRGGEPTLRKVTLVFENGALVEMIGVAEDAPADGDGAGVASATEPAREAEAAEEAEATEEAETTEEAEEAVAAADQAPRDSMESDPVAEPEAAPDRTVAIVPASDSPEAAETEFPGDETGAEAATQPALAEPAPTADGQAQAAAAREPGAADAVPVAPAPAAEPVEAASPEADLQDPALTGELPGSWIIQLGAFASRENAENLVRTLADAGIEAGIVTQRVRNLGERYLVRHGGLASRSEAEALLETIREAVGVEGFAIPPS
jgi:outer membrane protein assembly factor BamE